jgi:hypothetical protein
MGGYYITDVFLFFRHPSVKAFWQWFSYDRMWFIPAIRDEVYGQALTCTPAEEFPFDLTGISNRGLGGAAKNYTTVAVQGNPTLVSAMNSFDQWENASADVNATVNSLYQNALNLDNLRQARNAAVTAGSVDAAITNLNEQIAVSTAAFGAATGIAPTNTAAIDSALTNTVNAASILGFANYLVANPLPSAMTCFYADGEAYLVNALALDWVTLNSTGGVASYGIDHFLTTSTGFYMRVVFLGIGWSGCLPFSFSQYRAVAFITGIGWSIIAYFAL